jgi:NADH-quinone oxidoreductase subunit A
MNASAADINLWPLAIYALAVVVIVSFMIGFSVLLGEKHRERTTLEPYESGALPLGPTDIPVNVRFYLIAVFFVIFDLESVFVFAWAVSVRELGWPGYIEILVFIALLLAALVYLWRAGALDIGYLRPQIRKRVNGA